MTLQEFATKKILTKQQTEELPAHIKIIAEAIVDYIINNNLLNHDNNTWLCEAKANNSAGKQ